MENTPTHTQETNTQMYNHAAHLLINERKTTYEVTQNLIEQGMDADGAKVIVDDIDTQIRDAKKAKANRDMLYGALWCVGGTVATLANFGYVFWGAIVFGAIQFFSGLYNSNS